MRATGNRVFRAGREGNGGCRRDVKNICHAFFIFVTAQKCTNFFGKTNFFDSKSFPKIC